MPEKSSDTGRASSDPTELERAIRACRSAFAACAMFSLAINVLMLTLPVYMLQVYDRVLTTGRVETLIMLTLIATIALAVMCALDALRTAITIRVGCWLNEQLGPAYLACAVRGRLRGDLSGAEPLRDISQIQSFIATQGLTAFFDAPWVPIFVAMIWILHPMLGFVALSSAVVLFLLSIVNEVATRKANQTANRKQIEATLLADATIRNAEIVQAMHMLPAMTDRWAAVNGTVVDGLRRSGDVGGLVLATTKFVRLFVQVAILGVGAWLVVNSQLTAGAMIAGSILLGRALAPVELAISVWRNFNAARFSYGRLKKTIGDHPAPLKRTRLPAPRGRVVVDAVSYLTPNTAQLIVSQVSCAVEPGELLAIIGPSGAGKSTLCRLMVGLAIPNVGEIRLDGSPIHHWEPAQFGRHVGFLPQDVELFAGSVRDNVARMQSVDDEAVVNAATLACAHEMIQHLPQGYDTWIGDGGVRLSGGQRQRVGLARAVFGSPRFIVLDEPNANLDQAGEAALSKAIVELKQAGVALVIVGHRPSTLSAADRPRRHVRSARRCAERSQRDFGGVASGNQQPRSAPAHIGGQSAPARRLRSQRQACGRRIVTSHVEKFAPDGQRSSQMLRIEQHHGNVSPVMSGPPPKPSIRVPARLGNALILAFATVFGGWGYFAPLDGGAVAPGVINPDSGKKTIQHLEGGIIAEMRVREGETVTIGQPLVVLESTQARAAHESLVQQRWSLLARKARLDAESAEQNQIEWPPELLSADRQIRSIVEAQQEVFDARRLTHATKKSVLAQRIEQLTQQIKGNEAQVESTSRQIDFISEELQAKEYLVARGLIPKPEALRLRRVDAEISGKRGEYLAAIARLGQEIGEAKLQILSADAERADQIATDADKVRADLTEVTEKLHSSADVLQRTVVVAPVSGTVVDVKFKTVGGVVQRGEPIMSIVPASDELIIEGRVTPLDRKAVHSGLQAQIHLSAYSSRVVPKIPGTVRTVSADSLVDDTTHQPYYLARVAVDRQTLKRLAPTVDLIPGMPVEVLIVTERRTMFDYISKPFRDAFWRSFREI